MCCAKFLFAEREAAVVLGCHQLDRKIAIYCWLPAIRANIYIIKYLAVYTRTGDIVHVMSKEIRYCSTACVRYDADKVKR